MTNQSADQSIKQAWLDGPEGGTDGRTDEHTDGRKISPFYRTLSPIRAAALPPPMKTKEKVEQGKGTADHLMPLGYLLKQDLQIAPWFAALEVS